MHNLNSLVDFEYKNGRSFDSGLGLGTISQWMNKSVIKQRLQPRELNNCVIPTNIIHEKITLYLSGDFNELWYTDKVEFQEMLEHGKIMEKCR